MAARVALCRPRRNRRSPGVIMSTTEPAGARNAPLLGRWRVTPSGVVERDDGRRARPCRRAGRTAARSCAPCTATPVASAPGQQAPDAPRAAAAAIAPRAAGVGIDLVALDAHREGHLQHLDRRVHGVGDAAGDDVDAVLGGARAEAALDGLVGHVAAARARVDAAEREDRRRALAAGHHAVRPEAAPARPSPCRRRGARSRGWRRRRARETRR